MAAPAATPTSAAVAAAVGGTVAAAARSQALVALTHAAVGRHIYIEGLQSITTYQNVAQGTGWGRGGEGGSHQRL